MKFSAATILALTAVAISGPAFARGFNVPSKPATVQQRQFSHQANLERLREKAIEMRNSDGGEWTAEHRAELQRELDYINRRYELRLRETNPFALDAYGRSAS